MKVKIKKFNGELPEYLTFGKEYEFFPSKRGGNAGEIISDDGGRDFILLNDCMHIGNGSWEVIKS